MAKRYPPRGEPYMPEQGEREPTNENAIYVPAPRLGTMRFPVPRAEVSTYRCRPKANYSQQRDERAPSRGTTCRGAGLGR